MGISRRKGYLHSGLQRLYRDIQGLGSRIWGIRKIQGTFSGCIGISRV